MHIFSIDKQENVAFMDKYGNIHFQSIKDTLANYTIKFPDSLNILNNNFSVRFYNNFLYVFLTKRKKIYSYYFDKGEIFEDKVYDIGKVLNSDEYFVFNHNNVFEIHFPYLFIGYGIQNKHTNFLDNEAYLLIDLNQDLSPKNASKILPMPSVFKNKIYHNSETHINFLNDSTLIYGFTSCDSIYKYNFIKKKYLASSLFNDFSNFREYKSSMNGDLGYLRWHEVTNEANLKFLHVNDSSFLIIKKLKKENLSDTSIYEYLLLKGKDFSVQKDNLFPMPINSIFSLSYKNGVLLFNLSLEKAYYYEP